MNENGNARTVTAVLVELKQEIHEFVQTRLQLFVTELRGKIQEGKSAAMVATAGLLLLWTAWLLVNLAIAGLIAVAFWGSPFAWPIAFGILGAFWLIVGLGFSVAVIGQFRRLIPEKTLGVLKQDKIWLEREARHQV